MTRRVTEDRAKFPSSPSLHHTAFGMVDKYNKVLPLVLEVLMLFDIIDFSFDYD
ncbi:MAG: hypothetical protein ACI8RD_008194 [Bacillariaceae sp.]|jgi:hypothetical protein